MQVNLNPNINQSRPQFKARFANDLETKKSLQNLLPSNRYLILATHFALNDIKTDDQIALRKDSCKYYARNLTNGKEVCLKSGIPISSEAGMVLLNKIIKKELTDEAPKHNYHEYLSKAKDYLKETFNSENNIIKNLESTISDLTQQLNHHKNELNKVENGLISKESRFIEKNILKIVHK